MNSADTTHIYDLPLNFHSLVIENTNRCNAQCKICYQSAGPKGSEIDGESTLPIEIIKKVIQEATTLPNLTRRFHLSGGEAFLLMDQSIEIYEHAKQAGFIDLTGTTNGFWAKNYDHGLKQARRLRQAGVTSLELSADCWHQEEIGSESISNCIEVCRAVGIAINLRMLASRSHRHKEALLALRPDALSKANRITCSKVFSVGRAQKELPRDEVYKKGISGNCYSAANLTINAFGDVYPCCAGLDQASKISFGNIKNISILESVRNIEQSAIYRTIAFCGVGHYHPILKKSGIDLGAPQDFGNPCDFCWTIFSEQKCVDIINDYHSDLAKNSISAAIHYLESRINAPLN